MGPARRLSTSQSTQHLRAAPGNSHSHSHNHNHKLNHNHVHVHGPGPGGLRPSASSVSLPFPHSASLHSLLAAPSPVRTSGTWTTSSGELGLLSDTDEVEDRAVFIHEYNRLAKKHGVRLLMVDDFTPAQQGHVVDAGPEKRGWLHRLLRPGLAQQQKQARHGRSVSDLAHVIRSRREPPRLICIQEMVRLSGKSMLYLPHDYAPCSLALPTCLRATAHHLAQNAATRGLFRVPGSARVVAALFNHYCRLDDDVATTVRCATLPLHIACSVHDVASAFKRLLSVLPGGILGELALFDALVAIHSQLDGQPEFPRTKQTKVRARLIALAIGTIKSQFRRELVCAVVGLLSLIGRVAELTPREDADGRPLPTTDLMGYHALGIIFGPLLVGHLLDQYTMQLAAPTAGMLLLPLSPHKLLRDRRKTSECGPPAVDKILVANGIAEMLIANWRDVVRQMKSLGAHNRRNSSLAALDSASLRPSASQAVGDKGPKDEAGDSTPEPGTPTAATPRRRSRSLMHAASHKLLPKSSVKTLSPTKEESLSDDEAPTPKPRSVLRQAKPKLAEAKPPKSTAISTTPERDVARELKDREHVVSTEIAAPPGISQQQYSRPPGETSQANSQLHIEAVPLRVSSRSRHEQDGSDTTQTVMPPSVIEVAGLSSPALSGGRLERRHGRFRKAQPSNNVSSYDGSEDSVAPLRSPRVDARFQPGFQSPREKSVSRLCNGLSPQIRVAANTSLLGSEESDNRPKSSQAQSRLGGNGLDDADKSSPRHPTWTPRKRGHVRRGTDEAQKGSIGSTPDRFYPRADPLRSHPSKERREGLKGAVSDGGDETWTKSASRAGGRVSAAAHGNTAPQKLEMVKNMVPGLSSSPKAWEKRERLPSRQAEVSEKSPLSRRSRASRSPRPWRVPFRLQVQSPTQSSSSGALGKRASVKAMAALFKSQGSTDDAPMSLDKGKGLLDEDSLELTLEAPCIHGRLFQAGLTVSRDASGEAPETSREGNVDEEGVGAVNGDAAAPRRLSARRSMPALPSADGDALLRGRLRQVPSLGTMVPCREPPPVAQHLKLARPPSTQVDEAPAASLVAPTPFDPATRSTTVLFAQVQSLQKSLDAKADEAAQLRRQLEAAENSDVGTLSEQLRTARRDLSMWRERAEAAEKRVQVFERFTSRLRGIKAAMVAAQETAAGDSRGCEEDGLPRDEVASEEGSGTEPGAQVGDETGVAKSASMVSARIAKSLHGHSSWAAPPCRGSNAGSAGGSGVDGTWSPSGLTRDEGASEVWAAAEELLRMEDDEIRDDELERT